MRVVLCDREGLLRDLVEALVTRTGHEIAGIADGTVGAVQLLEAAPPDAVIVDLSLEFNSDFDIIETAIAVGARVIVFSHNADHTILSRYRVVPTVVPKPDLAALEQVLERLDADSGGGTIERDRRRNPQRAASGPSPTGVSDAQAFFEAVNGAQAGDAMLAIHLADESGPLAIDLLTTVRATDRVAAFATGVRLLLVGGDEEGIRSVLQRVSNVHLLPASTEMTKVIVRDGEHGADAFDRLKHEGERLELPPPVPPA